MIKAKAIIFDMDGVITNTMPDHYRVWKKIFRKHGIVVSRFEVYEREGQKGIDSIDEIFEQHGKPLTTSAARKILRQKERAFRRKAGIRFIPGARQFLKSLHSKQFRLGLVTGTSRKELNQILPEGLRRLFHARITGTDVRDGKPHPEPYLKALQLLHVKPKDAIVIENAPLGIASAKGAGLRCLAIATSLPAKRLKRADRVFRSIKDLKRKVRFSRNKL